MRKFINFWLLMLLACSLIGCSSSMDVYLHAAQKLNQDQQYKSLPVQVKIYQLSNQNAFNQATFRELWQADAATLGNSLLDTHTIIVNPGGTEKIKIPRKGKCNYVGIIAIFRNPQGDNWRVLHKIPSNISIFSLAIKTNLYGNKISLVN